MPRIDDIGAEWLAEEAGDMIEVIEHVTPVSFNEKTRYLPESVSSKPGYIDYSVTPYMREIVNCFDVDSPVRQVDLKKGVQVAYTTSVLESGMFYYLAHVKTRPMMYMTADKELADARMENNIITMLVQSDMMHIIRSSDVGNSRKTGKTKNHLQVEGGGYMVPFGANNANKMRQFSICVLFKDEIDGWPDIVGGEKAQGDPDELSDARCDAYPTTKKIFRGSTPLWLHNSKIEKAYLMGDQRKYQVRCRNPECGEMQEIRWSTKRGEPGGFKWEFDDAGTLIPQSVRWCCAKCDHPHYERDKRLLFAEEHGAKWVPTAIPKVPFRRSYHLPALYSSFKPWYECAAMWLEAFDPAAEKVLDIGKYQVFYNNILAEPFEKKGAKVTLTQVSAHRRTCYGFGTIPNNFANLHAKSKIMFLTCQADIHKSNIACAVMGWTVGGQCFLVDYWRFHVEKDGDDLRQKGHPVWQKLRAVVDEKKYVADDGTKYRINTTLVDAGDHNDVVVSFCGEWEAGVFPIVGRSRPAKNQRIREFNEFKTQLGTLGYTIIVDHYKDRLAPVLRRDWNEDEPQGPYHFNAPTDIEQDQLRELTREYLAEKTNEKGEVWTEWHRPGNAPNELWDLLVYGNAAVDIVANYVCTEVLEMEEVEWEAFWDFCRTNPSHFAREDPA